MTRKHYVMLAQWCGHSNVSDYRVQDLVEMLEEDNPRFDKHKFLQMFKDCRQQYEAYNTNLLNRLRA